MHNEWINLEFQKKVTTKKQPNENSTSKVKNLLSGLPSRIGTAKRKSMDLNLKGNTG